MSAHVNTIERDFIREKLFKDSYGLHVTIRYTAFNDKDWNWDMCVLNFRDSLGKNYGLVEYFKSGDDNSTDYVIFEYEDSQGKFNQVRFDETNAETGRIFYTAEQALVDLINKRLKGED